MLVEQAIFTSAQTDRADGYQLAGRSRGLSAEDARELAVWGPSHDSLLQLNGEPASTNFHRLASGAFCVSRTTLAGVEYSGRGGSQVYTQFLIVPPELFAKFSNNAFAIIRAASASGSLGVGPGIPEVLEPFRLNGRAPACDLPLLAALALNPGPAVMAALVQAALSCERLAVAPGSQAEAWFAGLVSLLPIGCRPEFSFSTGLKFSPNRAVRVSALPDDPSSWRAIARQGISVIDLQTTGSSENRWEGWAGCIEQILASGRLSLLATQIEQSRSGPHASDLHQLSEQLQARLQNGSVRAAGNGSPAAPPAQSPFEADCGASNQRADAAHIRTQPAAAAVASGQRKSSLESLADAFATQPPAVVELLERIDDLIFSAIAGDAGALAELEVLWPIVADELDQDLVEQSREQYLRCALAIWTECAGHELENSARAMSAIDVICLLFET